MFTWRHLLTLYVVYKILKVLLIGNLPVFPFTLYILAAAIGCDWLKKLVIDFIKFRYRIKTPKQGYKLLKKS